MGGIAAGLGFDLLDKHFRPRHPNRPTRKLCPNHLTVEHDFKQELNRP
ncbi:hypothetical protein BH18THE2_BH18THE2_17230 [soil metagenome]